MKDPPFAALAWNGGAGNRLEGETFSRSASELPRDGPVGVGGVTTGSAGGEFAICVETGVTAFEVGADDDGLSTPPATFPSSPSPTSVRSDPKTLEKLPALPNVLASTLPSRLVSPYSSLWPLEVDDCEAVGNSTLPAAYTFLATSLSRATVGRRGDGLFARRSIRSAASESVACAFPPSPGRAAVGVAERRVASAMFTSNRPPSTAEAGPRPVTAPDPILAVLAPLCVRECVRP